MSFYRGNQKLTSSKCRGLAYVKTEPETEFLEASDKGIYMREQLQLSVGELVYGLRRKIYSICKEWTNN